MYYSNVPIASFGLDYYNKVDPALRQLQDLDVDHRYSQREKTEKEKQIDEERDKICKRYAEGRSKLDDIEPWEEPSFSLYAQTDVYGFIHETPIPDPPMDMKKVEKMRIKEKKWVKMIHQWEKTGREPEELRKRIWKGCPNSLRLRLWPLLLRLKEIKEKAEQVQGPNIYERMRRSATKRSTDIRQIDLDVHRTYRDHRMFREKYGVMQQKLFNVLSAYSMYNQEVGYCQGMANVVALMLMYMKEEDAFWSLTSLLRGQRYQMNDFFTPKLPKLFRCFEHHEKLRKKFVPSVHKHFNKLNVMTTWYAAKWFLQCFLDRVPFSLALRVWDIYLYEGEEVETAMAIALLRMFKKTITKLTDEELSEFLQNLSKQQVDEDKIIDVLAETISELRRSQLSHLPPPPPEDLPHMTSSGSLPNLKVKKNKKSKNPPDNDWGDHKMTLTTL